MKIFKKTIKRSNVVLEPNVLKLMEFIENNSPTGHRILKKPIDEIYLYNLLLSIHKALLKSSFKPNFCIIPYQEIYPKPKIKTFIRKIVSNGYFYIVIGSTDQPMKFWEFIQVET